MQIFCKETQAHLDLNPHLKVASKTSHDNLITPDLWMRNCRSRSITPPDEDLNDDDDDQQQQEHLNDSSELTPTTSTTTNQIPTIKVAAASKFLQSACESEETIAKLSQHEEPKSKLNDPKDHSSTIGQKSKNLRKRRANRLSSSSSSAVVASAPIQMVSDNGNLSEGSSNENRNSYSKRMRSTAKNMMGVGVSERQRQNQQQHLRTINEQHQPQNAAIIHRYQMIAKQQQQQQQSMPNSSLFRINRENRSLQTALRQSRQYLAPLPNHAFTDASTAAAATTITVDRSPKISPQHSPYGNRTAAAWQCPEPMNSTRKNIFNGENQRIFTMHQPPLPPLPPLPPPQHHHHQQQPHRHQHKLMALNEFVSVFGTVTPPTTLLIPYPIVLPLPIPIPLPYEAFLRAATRNNKNVNSQNGNASSSSNNNNIDKLNNHTYCRENEEPLDFTKGSNHIHRQIDVDDDDDDDEDDEDDNDFIDWDDRRQTLRSTLSKVSSLSPSPHVNNNNNNTNHNNNRLRAKAKEIACENNRPLRKRKRIIDCDYLRLIDSNNSAATVTSAVTTNINNNQQESIKPRKSI